MKKIIRVALGVTIAAAMCSCVKTSPDPDIVKVLTFEGNQWNELIDSPQYGGPLLYGESYEVESEWGNYTSYRGVENYSWADFPATFLMSELVKVDGKAIYWNGGGAISHYVGGDLKEGTSMNQLTVYKEGAGAIATRGGGYDGSDNFCVHTGNAQAFEVFGFDSSAERQIDYLYVNNTLYTVAVLKDGNYYCPAIKAGEWFKVIATGYDWDGKETGSSEFLLADGPDKIVTTWTKWDISSLGKVRSVKFTFQANGDLTGEYGVNVPTYVAYDNVTLK